MKLSIITINLNNKDGLLKTIKSVIEQTYDDFEFIIFDGVSADGSVDVIREYENQIDYWVSEPDKGIYNAMNKGIMKARGEYCYFLNSGDVFFTNDVLKEIFEGNRSESFVCGNYINDVKGVLTKQSPYQNRDWMLSLYDIYSGFLNHQSFFIRRDMFGKYGLYDERFRIMSDWKLFFIAIGIHNEPVSYRDVDIVVYDTEGFSSRVGGRAIYEEKKKIAKEVLSTQVFQKVDRLYNLERNDYMIDFIYSKKWIHFIFRVFLKLCLTLKLTKI